MKLLKLIPVASIVITAFTTFEAKAVPHGWTTLDQCSFMNTQYSKVQNTDTTTSYGVWQEGSGDSKGGGNSYFISENVSYDSATSTYESKCDQTFG